MTDRASLLQTLQRTEEQERRRRFMKQICKIKPLRDIQLNLTCEKHKGFMYNGAGIGHFKRELHYL